MLREQTDKEKESTMTNQTETTYKVQIGKKFEGRVTEQEIRAAAAKWINANVKKITVRTVKGDALETATGRGLHSAIFSADGKRQVVINIHYRDGRDYACAHLSI